MGLEMYAYRRQYVKIDEEPERSKLEKLLEKLGKTITAIRPKRIAMIDNQVMFWLKANHIHQWFVNNVQKGYDDCGKYFVSWEKLKELKDACAEVLKSSQMVDGLVYGGTFYSNGQLEPEVRRIPGKVIQDASVAQSLLPTNGGVFFGNDDYDEHYLNEVQATKEWIESMLADKESGILGDIYYESRW